MNIKDRRPGERITFTTRRISNEVANKRGMYSKILEVLESTEEPLSAKDIAIQLFQKRLLPTDSRQEVAPRLTEMSTKGWIEPTGAKQRDQYSGILVTVYKLRKAPQEIRKEISERVKEK